MRHLLFVSLIALLLLSTEPARADAVIGQPAPALSGPLLDGKNFDLSVVKGKVAIVYFWATWAPPCRLELPTLEAVWRQYHGKGLEVVAVAADRPRARGDVDQVMHYFTFPAAMLASLAKNDFGNPITLPVAYVVDKDGVVQAIFTPALMPMTEPMLGETVKSLLEAKPEEPKKAETKDEKTEDKK